MSAIPPTTCFRWIATSVLVQSLYNMSDLYRLLSFLICHQSFPQAYNIHVNGVLHCRVRYSQLLGLHEQVSLNPLQYTNCCQLALDRNWLVLHVWHTERCLNATTSTQHDLSLVFVSYGRYASLLSLWIMTTTAWTLVLLSLPEFKLLHVNG